MIQGISDKVDKMVQTIMANQMKVSPEGNAATVKANKAPEPKIETAAPEVKSGQKAAVDPEALETAVNQINEQSQAMNYKLSLAIDRDTNRVLIRFKDPGSGEVVRQIPPDVVLEIAKRFDELKGALYDNQG